MVMQLDQVRDEVIRVCSEEYETCQDNQTYFMAKNDTSYNVRQNIMSKMKPEFLKMKYLDSVAYILDVDGNVFINVT